MTTQTVVKSWGNGQGIRLTKSVLEAANITLEDILQVETSENTIVLKKKFRHRTFEDRLAEFGGKINVLDFEWGEPQGRELL